MSCTTSELDKLIENKERCKPPLIGSWITISAKHGMDGGWYFPEEIPINIAFQVAEKQGGYLDILEGWAKENGFTTCWVQVRIPCNTNGHQHHNATQHRTTHTTPQDHNVNVQTQQRDCGAAPPWQTIYKFRLKGTFKEQVTMASEAMLKFKFPGIPAFFSDKWDVLTEINQTPLLLMVTVTC